MVLRLYDFEAALAVARGKDGDAETQDNVRGVGLRERGDLCFLEVGSLGFFFLKSKPRIDFNIIFEVKTSYRTFDNKISKVMSLIFFD